MARMDSLRMRAGQIFCVCDIDGLPIDIDQMPERSSIMRIAFAFASSIFIQSLVLSSLPLATAAFSLDHWGASLPYIVFLIGAAAASLPASLLLDRFGRRSAFALGASLGLAGGILAMGALLHRLYPVFLIGCLWLGISQGFGFFYRHAGALAGGAAGFVFAAGTFGAFSAPIVMTMIDYLGGPLAPVYTLGIAGAFNIIVLGLAVGLPSREIIIESDHTAITRPPWAIIVIATGFGAFAWFIMTGLMARSPLLMSGCGLSFSIMTLAMSVHLAAMYLPGFTIGRFLTRFGATKTCLLGLILMLVGVIGLFEQSSWGGFSTMLALAGFGWGTTTMGSTALIYKAGRPSLSHLALHDAVLFLSAILGVFSFIAWT